MADTAMRGGDELPGRAKDHVRLFSRILLPWDQQTTSHWIEIVAATLLAAATIASSWSAYQATRWSGVQALALANASAMRTESVRLSTQAAQLTGIDVGLFTQYAAAYSEGNTKLADFLRQRFSPELQTAFDAWVATQPLTNPNAPKSPFDMKEYVVSQEVDALRLQEAANQKTQVATDANQTGDNYILTTVLFALVLFFAGVGTKFNSLDIRVAILALGSLVFLVGVVLLIRFPVA